jgi:D-alanyl-D-alanine carboxypeptidase
MRRLMTFAAMVAAVAAAAAAVMLTGGGHSPTHGLHTTAADAATGRPAPSGTAARTLSPAGLPLARPALALAGLTAPQQSYPVQIAFRSPPREGLLFNLTTGKVLWALNPLARVPIASLTKMMTALLTVKSAAPDTPVLITHEAVNADGSKVGVLPLGRHVRLESLLYGLLLPSGNDAAVALAEHVAGTVNKFVARMNAEAAQLGMGCTRYSSPSGYFDAHNFSCAADLALLAHVDMEQPRIASVVRTYQAAIPFPIKGGKLYLSNNNPLLIYGYPGVTGMKTGYTEAAGRCLVATAERDGVRLGAIVLDSNAPGTQDSQLLNRGFHDVYHLPEIAQTPLPPGA